MSWDRSSKDLSLRSNERLFLKKELNDLIKFQIIKNFSPKYVKFYTFHVGFKKKKDDLLFVVFDNIAPLAAVYSKTSTPAAPIIWNKKNNKGFCKVLIVNSGNANAHTGKKGIKSIDKYVKIAAKTFQCKFNEIVVSSTGVIGEELNIKKITKYLPFPKNIRNKNILSAAKSIMTTDTFPKISFKKIKIKSEEVRIFGFTKGSGMIYPNMGTMLAYIFIEANISKTNLQLMLKSNLDKSFNSICVDGDTSTNDTVILFSLQNGKKKKINQPDYLKKINSAVQSVMFDLSMKIICDGEGISKLMQININSAKNYKQASIIAFSIANSQLVKTAIAGQDANWGRVIMAIGKTNLNINQNKIKLKFGNLLVAFNGQINPKIDHKKLDLYMKRKKIEVNVDLGIGKYKRTVYASDLTHEYIRINADYRS